MNMKNVIEFGVLRAFFSLAMVGFVSTCFVSCAEAPKKSNDEIRAKAAAGYEELDRAVGEEQPAVTRPVVEQSATCPEGDYLKGEGLAASADQAALQARQNIAAQIQAKIVSSANYQKASSVDSSGKENLTSNYETQSKIYTKLENAQDAKIVYSGKYGNGYKAVACMSRADAEKPFLKAAVDQKDSLAIFTAALKETSHPLRIKELFKSAQQANTRYLEAAGFLNQPEMDKQVADLYASALSVYKDFGAHFEFYFANSAGPDAVANGEKNEIEKAFFARLSQSYKVTAGQCQQGLLLSLNVSDIKCADGSLGVNCSTTLYLSGTSCSGEEFFKLDASIKGTGKYSENEAKERLTNIIGTGDWFINWKTELDKWSMK